MRFFTEAEMTENFVHIQNHEKERLIACLLEPLKPVEYQSSDPNSNFKQIKLK